MDYRHELKFLVSEQEVEIIRYRLKPLMRMDEHQEEESYVVRSLYFDDLNDSCMRENEDGVDNRRKFRIRIYNGNDNVIMIEKKIKHRGMTRKFSEKITREQCLTYMSGRPPALTQNSSRMQGELFAEMKMNGMRPAVIVEYDRTAFVERRGNVRITLDRNISGNNKISAFLDKHLLPIPVLPVGLHILEVKYDQLLPQYISNVLEIGTLQQSSFSKYYYARDFIQWTRGYLNEL